MSEHDNEYRQQRLANMKKLTDLGHKPFGQAFERTGRLDEIRADFADEKTVSAAGRLMSVRDMGKSIFADIRDGSDRFQLYVQKKHIGDEAFDAFKLLDIGDHIGIAGTLFTTRTEEQSIKVDKWELLSKALLPLPEKWHGLKDVEARYRQRYLDLATNPEVRELFDKRIEAVHYIRQFLRGRGFSEVETPMIQTQPGGAAASPFQTHYNALNTDMYLRIAPELYLKRLLVGGFDKVFELNRNFRNEGLDRTHNPEFTMLEIYQAYTNVRGMKELIEGIITHVAEKVFGTLKVGIRQVSSEEPSSSDATGETAEAEPQGEPIDLTLPWREVAYKDLVKERLGDDWYEKCIEDMRKEAEQLGLETESDMDAGAVTHEIYEKTIERTLIQPTFVTRLPAELIPLAKACDDDESVVDVFELIIGGKEIAPAYSELNDPLEQRKRLEAQAGEDAQKVDEEFLTALEHGMPPAGGMGVGIDRLLMIMSGYDAIRDVILFPQLKPKQ